MQSTLQVLLKAIKGFNVVVIAGAQATVHAILVAALFMLVRGFVGTILYLDLKSLSLLLLIAILFSFLFGIMLLMDGAREILFRTLLSESNQYSQELYDRVLTPIAFALGCILLFWLLVLRPVEFWRLLSGEPLLGLAIGYFLAPTLIRRRLLARILESLGSA